MTSNVNRTWHSLSFVGITLLGAAGFGGLTQGQGAPPVRVGGAEITGIPEDWSHRHVVFSNPGTEQEAIQSGRHSQWQKVVNDPRYVLQQLKKNLPVQGPAAVDAEYRTRWDSEAAGVREPVEKSADDLFTFGGTQRHERPSPFTRRIKQPSIMKDWNMSLGGTGLAAGHYPAKYSTLGAAGASCSDYVVFPTGAAGSTTQATIVAFTSLYVGTGGCAGGPSVDWAYNTGTGATANLSPVLSLDGTQVAFVQTSGGTASLVILKMANSGGAVAVPTFGSGQGLVSNANYRGCTAPCYTTLSLGAADTNSAPFYNYSGNNADKLFVGDNTGHVHEVTGVFSGTPLLDAGGVTNWPVAAANATQDPGFTAFALNSPIYDSISQNVFVGDASGFLHQFQGLGSAGTVHSSSQMECGTGGFPTGGLVDSVIVDSTSENVYAFVGDGCDVTPGNSYVNRFAAGSSIATYGQNAASFGNAGTNDTATVQRAGTFDDQYFASSGVSGNLYSCVNGRVYQTPMASLNGTTAVTPNTFSTVVANGQVGDGAACSPATEFLGVKVATTVNGAGVTTTTQTTVPVASTTGMAVGDFIQVDFEIMHIVTPLANPLNVTRAQLGTTAATHAAGAAVQDVQDWLFLSVIAHGNATGCTGACLYNFNVIGGAATGTAVAGQAAAGGTSGIVIDNLSTTQVGAEQIYYNLLSGTTNNAIQASQSAP